VKRTIDTLFTAGRESRSRQRQSASLTRGVGLRAAYAVDVTKSYGTGDVMVYASDGVTVEFERLN
jgi:hypothetical protein